MRVTPEKIDKTRVQVTVEVPEEMFEESIQKAYKVMVKKVNVPGFRKGKAPRKLIENIYGIEVFYEQALEDAVPKAYMKALDEIKDDYVAVSQPEYEVIQVEKGKPLVFKATFDIKPEVVLGQYKGLELEKKATEITGDDIDAELNNMRERFAKLSIISEGNAQNKDILLIDFIGKIDGEVFSGGTGENYPLELGSGSFIPGFEDQLIGTKASEMVDVKVNFPEDYHAAELAGKEAVFSVTVKEIKRKELADLDDEFAKDVSEFETLQELRQDIENKLKEKAEKKAEYELRVSAIKKAAENAEIELPASMIDSRINQMIEDLRYRLQQQGVSLDNYLQMTNKSVDEIKDVYRDEAESSVRADLVIEEIAKVENIKATEEDLEKEVNKIAEAYKQEPAKVREAMEKQGQILSLEVGIMIDKAVDFIIEQAKIC